MSLKEYHRKRHFKRTTEPFGKKQRGSAKHLYVIQKHAASHLHYDFRLELNGVLLSWAVPKGPSLDPSIKRLAMHVEDHPIDYANFEGVIPAGEYGGGTVMIWDKGTWEPLDDSPSKAYSNGDLTFILHGKKLKGRWKLIKLKKTADKNANAWLLFKVKDEFSKKESEEKITTSEPRSVTTNRSLEEIAEDTDRVWTSEGEENKAKVKKTKYAKKPVKIVFEEIEGAKKQKLPKTIHPELATLVADSPKGDNWLHEIKWDGYRLIARIQKHSVQLLTRHQNDWTEKFPTIEKTLRRFKLKDAILDGEVVALDENNLANFQVLQNLMQESYKKYPLVYYVFDLLYFDGYSLFDVPLIERKRLLEQLIFAKHSSSEIKFNDHIVGNGQKVFKNACKIGLEGIISKRLNSIYCERRTKDWLKIKCIKRQEFVVVGFTDTQSSRKYFKALLLGFYNKKKQLQYCGKVGTGFTEASLREVAKQLYKYEQKQSSVDVFPTKVEKSVRWLKPKLVAEVEYFSVTDEGILRHPSFKGLRSDKDPKRIIFEIPVDVKQVEKKIIPEVAKKNKAVSRTKFTNLDRVLYPEKKFTKQDLVDYYEYIADWIMPHIRNRPLSVVRCPKGYRKECFYQKHVNETIPSSIKSIDIVEKTKVEPYIYISSFSGLMGLVQINVLEIHPWGSNNKNIEKPDRIIFDLDPDPKVDWQDVIDCAQIVREFFAYFDLISFVKTTGGKGLHVVVPIKPSLEWDEIKTISKKIAEIIVSIKPEKYLANMSKKKRSDKIFIDYLRNARGATAVAAYSTRAKQHAPISTPISWDELTTKIRSDSFNLSNIFERIASLKKDPWEDFFKIKQSITKKILKDILAY